jgi:uncharacterized OB-fold protein
MEQRPFSDYSFEQFLAEEKLMGSKCQTCEALFVPPRPLCTECGGSEMVWFETRGRGSLKTFTCIAVGPPHMRKEGYGRHRPYCTGVVQLEEGPRVVARIEGVDANSPETLRIGMPLTLKLLHRDQDGRRKTFLAFKPA